MEVEALLVYRAGSGTMTDFTVCVATFGDESWAELAQRAAQSAESQAHVITYHGGESVAQARNACLDKVQTEFVIFLDADDVLEQGYVITMQQGSADIRAPFVRIIRQGRGMYRAPGLPWVVYCMNTRRHYGQDCVGDCLQYGNWIVVGAGARTELLRSVGGWGEEPIYEDWALWLRCWHAGASFESVPEAVYRQHISLDSRNHEGEAFDQRHEWHDRIVNSVLGHNPITA